MWKPKPLEKIKAVRKAFIFFGQRIFILLYTFKISTIK